MPERDAGFTVPEVLIASLLSMLVLGASLASFNNAMTLADTSRIVSETNQGLQAAISVMTRDFIQTGQGIPRGGVPIPSGGTAVPIVRPAPAGPAQAFPSTWVTMPALAPGGGLGPSVLGVTTDAVTLFYADPTLALNEWPLAGIAADGSTMTVDARTPITGVDGIQPGDIILFSNALGNAMQMVTATNGTQTVTFAAADALGLNQRAAPQGTLMQLQSAPGTFPPTTATRLLMITYYIDATTDPALPRLTRQVNAGPRRAIALGAENLQLTYDLVDGTTNPSNVESPAAPNSANQIRKVNLFLAGRSLDISVPTRQFIRNSMAVGIGLRSLSFVDRYR
ncbi:MAG: hypothetical protein IT184_08670 [Acidobacteria bacterium]|nr:hypothetical protein [Acidobacteriota bacterium]